MQTTFKELSLPLKIGIIGGFIYAAWIMILILAGLVGFFLL